MLHETLTTRLRSAHDFVEVAAVVCNIGRHELGLHRCVVTLQAIDARPMLMVDNDRSVTDDVRLAWTDRLWRHDPFQVAVRAEHAVVDDEMIGMPALDDLRRELGIGCVGLRMLLLPIVQTGELLGTIRCVRAGGFTAELRRDLTTLSGYVSVRLAQLGITTVPDPELLKLTPRQRDVALLAARGHTNGAIGAKLSLSHNTIKKHLQEVFAVLEVANRTELAARLRTSNENEVPVGVTQRGDVWITRAS